MIENEFGIKIFRTAPYTSCSNCQIERFNSTLQEIMRCLQTEKIHRSYHELLDRSVNEYNLSIHTVTGKKPIEAFFWQTGKLESRTTSKRQRRNN